MAAKLPANGRHSANLEDQLTVTALASATATVQALHQRPHGARATVEAHDAGPSSQSTIDHSIWLIIAAGKPTGEDLWFLGDTPAHQNGMREHLPGQTLAGGASLARQLGIELRIAVAALAGPL